MTFCYAIPTKFHRFLLLLFSSMKSSVHPIVGLADSKHFADPSVQDFVLNHPQVYAEEGICGGMASD